MRETFQREDHDFFADVALGEIPKLLTQLDQNVHRSTYGCFDRAYWQYKIKDFPSGMSQEFVWPLALAYTLEHPRNPYLRCERVRELCLAALEFARRSSHPDGSCDDYFPFEKAAGAKAFSLYAQINAYKLLAIRSEKMEEYFLLSAHWLAGHFESGALANHQAIMALCLFEVLVLLGEDPHLREAAQKRLTTVLAWQDPEGWFREYEGCDLGYLTFTISFLVKIHALQPDSALARAIDRAVDFVSEFIHPDGSFGGEYGSRNTYNFLPDGFELWGRPSGLYLNDRYLAGIRAGKRPCFEDDYILGHHLWAYLLAYKNFQHRSYEFETYEGLHRYFPNAGLAIWRQGSVSIVTNVKKGGVFACFSGRESRGLDTQISIKTNTGTNYVCHIVDDNDIEVEENLIVVRGAMQVANHTYMSTTKLLVFRVFMACFGRFYPDLVRRLLQKMLITSKRRVGFSFERRFERSERGIRVHDRIKGNAWHDVEDIRISQAQTSIYVVMSNVHQINRLKPWIDLNSRRPQRDSETLDFSRELL